jgi:hypothetical protein
MALKAVDHIFNGTTTPYTAYDSTKTNLGKHIIQNSGVNNLDDWAGPMPLAFARPFESSSAIAIGSPYVIDWSSTESWIFCAETGAGTTRRIVCYKYNKTTQDLKWNGFITLTYPTATNHTIRGLAVARHTYTTGTAATSGTAVTGASGAAWQTARIGAGCRIGFGSTDPTAITTWYHISAISTETSITLVENAGTISAGAYVIEELRVYTTTTNATAANGGLYVAKGISYDDFLIGGTNIAAATITDNLKAVYWLADAATVLNTVACGLAIDSTQSDTSHFLWVLNQDAGTTARIYKYNGRAALAGLVSGKSTSAFVFRTGTAATTGTIAATGQNGIIATAGHGPGSGAKSMYWVTAARIYRSLETSITNGGTGFLSDSLGGAAEVPTGGTNTFAATTSLTQVLYDSIIDRFIVLNLSNAQQYVTAYSSSTTTPLDHVFLFNTFQLDSSLTMNNSIPPIPVINATQFAGWSSDGMYYALRTGGLTTTSHLFIWPLSVDWQYASGGGTAAKQQRLITPSLDTTGCQKFYRVCANHQNFVGDSNLGLQNEPFRWYYRTSGISDDSGAWTLVSDTGDLTAITAASAIQFMFEFKGIGRTNLMQKMYNLSVIYEDDSTDSHYEPSIKNSDATSKIFAWRFSKAFGTTVPTLIVRIYDDVTDAIIAADTTASPSAGTFQKSTDDGGSWSSYDDTDKTNDITYIRYTVTGTVNGVKARAVLQQYGNQATGSGTPAGSLVKDITFGVNDVGDRRGLLLEVDVGTAQALSDINTTTNTGQDALVNELKQMPVPIANRRKVR